MSFNPQKIQSGQTGQHSSPRNYSHSGNISRTSSRSTPHLPEPPLAPPPSVPEPSVVAKKRPGVQTTYAGDRPKFDDGYPNDYGSGSSGHGNKPQRREGSAEIARSRSTDLAREQHSQASRGPAVRILEWSWPRGEPDRRLVPVSS